MQQVNMMDRVREMFDGTVPPVFVKFGHTPAFLADFYMNFKRFVWQDGYLDVRTKAAIGKAVSVHMGCTDLVAFLDERLKGLGVPEQERTDIRAIVATCTMYNAFFKLPDLSNSLFGGMAVGLRGHSLAGTSLDAKLVELVSIVISALNGCKTCTSGHIASARRLGLFDEAILESVQCGATIAAGCSFLVAL